MNKIYRIEHMRTDETVISCCIDVIASSLEEAQRKVEEEDLTLEEQSTLHYGKEYSEGSTFGWVEEGFTENPDNSELTL
jgi:hypothetical protein